MSPPFVHSYSYIPHPMIVSQVWALLGIYKAAHYRADWPYVVPIHIGLYLVHMLQEQFDVYRRYPEDRTREGREVKRTAASAKKVD